MGAVGGLNAGAPIRSMRIRKRFGQHFLQPDWADKLVAVIDPRPHDRFLEIGPGAGVLTLRLAPRVEHLTAVEVDRDLVAGLAPNLPPNVRLIESDFLAMNLDDIVAGGPALRIAGNLPYNVASPILFRLLESWREWARRFEAGPHGRTGSRPWRDATLMVQREVAERLEASPGSREYGVLSICSQLYANVRRLLNLPPGAFRPPPQVHSAVVHLTFRPAVVALRDHRVFEQMVRAMFTQRRKMLSNALAPFAASRQVDPRAALEASGINPARRPETLDLAELGRLAEYFVEQ